MHRASFFQRLLAAAFTTLVLFTVSIHQVHYLFSAHQPSEHCANHLHSTDEHTHCPICHFETFLFTDAVPSFYAGAATVHRINFSHNYTSPLLTQNFSCQKLRGPPFRIVRFV